MRKKLYDIIEPSDGRNMLSTIYDCLMMLAIIASIVPLAFKTTNSFFVLVDKITLALFIFDYFARLFTADLKMKDGISSFILYPFTPMAIIDLLSILPSLAILKKSLQVLKLFRVLRALKVLRAFKFIRYSKTFGIIINVFNNQKKILTVVATMAVSYVLLSALIIYNVEPESFETFFDAVYWATISLTTVGYGDIYPITTTGRVFTMISSVFGIAIIALPSGVITAGYLDEIHRMNKEKDGKDENDEK